MLLPFYRKGFREAGCDEAGRGCLAGPVVAAAVILPDQFYEPDLNDSKKLSKAKREELRDRILESAIGYGLGVIDNHEIDKINILHASFKAMHLAIGQLEPDSYDLLIIDGNRFIPYRDVEHVCVVKGDARYMSVAAASILAKTYRDDLMNSLAASFPQYQWHRNAGYPTLAHRKAIREFGITDYHRRSFKLLDDQLKIEYR